ncbi:polysaccharide biosynthesis C-terminal domain-containing protein, partial [Streptomyces brasiliscabiei]
GQQYLLPTNQIKSYSSSVILGAVVNIVFNIPFIYLWGLTGAICATILSETSVTLFQIYKVRTQVDLKKVFLNVPKYLIAGLVMFLIVIKVNTSTHFNVISLIGQIA